MNYISRYNSIFGEIILASDGKFLTGLWLPGQLDFDAVFGNNYEEKALTIFDETKRWLDLYFQGKNPEFMPQISYEGTPFQKIVWDILCTIPYGQTMTYGEIAKKIAKEKGIAKMSAQAVGGAVGRNPISVIVPCHRVLGANGKLTGYAGGIDKKIKLLEIEKVNLTEI